MPRFESTRGRAPALPFTAAMLRGLAPDGGLYVPERFPRVTATDVRTGELHDIARAVLAPFLAGDLVADRLDVIVEGAFTFPLPLVATPGAHVLELWHGPTAAFKDVGARFLARCLAACDDTHRTVLVATSGDTGSAVAAALDGLPGLEVVVLFPQGGVSREQEELLTCWGPNVHSFAVAGTFDDCQRMLKEALATPEALGTRTLTTANSINVARLLAQVVYYASAGLQYHAAHGRAPTFVVPTGNVGNATACLWAKRMGLPVAGVVCATNANRPVADYLETGSLEPRPSVPTLANAMDVGAPSNLERVIHLYGGDLAALRRDVRAIVVDDATIRAELTKSPDDWGRILDPHTATAAHAVRALDPPDAVVVSTAHPAKFRSTVEPLLGTTVEVPATLAELHARRRSVREVAPRLDALAEALG